MIREARPYYGPVTIVAIWHIASGIAVAMEPKTIYVSILAGLNTPFAALILLVTGGLALWARTTTRRYATVLIVPQQVLLIVQAWSVAYAIWQGTYPDGYMPIPGNVSASRWFISGDQIITLILIVWHSMEMALMAYFTLLDKGEADEIKEMRSRLASYEESGKWVELIEEMEFSETGAQRIRPPSPPCK